LAEALTNNLMINIIDKTPRNYLRKN